MQRRREIRWTIHLKNDACDTFYITKKVYLYHIEHLHNFFISLPIFKDPALEVTKYIVLHSVVLHCITIYYEGCKSLFCYTNKYRKIVNEL